MCVFLANASVRRLVGMRAGTIVALSEATVPGIGYVHVLWYQNAVQSGAGPNAMLLHLPSAQPMTPHNMLNTSSSKSVLTDMVDAIDPPQKSLGLQTRGMPQSFSQPAVQIFEHDIYTVVLARDASYIPDALERVPTSKRPSLNREVFDWYAQEQAGWHVALCCFNNSEAQTASPIGVWYAPQYTSHYHFPGIDAHDGSAPDMYTQVDVDHWLIAGVQQERQGFIPVHYGNVSPSLKPFLPTHVAGRKFIGQRRNGDWIMPADLLPTDGALPLLERRLLPGIAV